MTQQTNRCAQLINVLTETDTNLPRIVEVLWEDAIGGGEQWDSEHDINQYKPEPTISIGYVWAETPTHLHLISTTNTTHTCNSILIPTGCIKWTREIR